MLVRIRLTNEQRSIIRQAIQDGLSYSEAAALAGCKTATAKSYARRGRLESPKTLLWEEQQDLAREEKRRCPKCQHVLPLTSFRLYDGKAKYSYCLDCCRENERERAETLTTRIQRIVAQAKARSTAKGVVFDLVVDDVFKLWNDQNGYCAYTGELMTTKLSQRNTVSLDRIVPNKGYVPGNIVLCCDIVNKMKWDMDVDELIQWCERIIQHAKR